MSTLFHKNKYEGGFCYAACQDLYNFFNPSTLHCRKGCDFGEGRVNDPAEHKRAEDMCKRYTAELYPVVKGELDALVDLRVHADMFPTNGENLYRACLSGVRRQLY